MPIALALALVLLFGPADDGHPWAKFKVGTWVKWKTITAMKTAAGTSNFESETKQTLVSLTAQKAVVEFVQSAAGAPAPEPTLVDLPFKPEPVDPKLAAQAPKPSKTGTETLTIAGKAFSCTWSETVTGDKDSGRTVMRTWESADMPGRIVRSV